MPTKPTKKGKKVFSYTFKLLIIIFTTLFLLLSFSFAFKIGSENTFNTLSNFINNSLYSVKGGIIDIKSYYHALNNEGKKSTNIDEIIITLGGKLNYNDSIPTTSKGKLKYLMNLDSLVDQDTVTFLSLNKSSPLKAEEPFINSVNSSLEVLNLSNIEENYNLDYLKNSNTFNIHNTLKLNVKGINIIFFEYDELVMDKDSLLTLKEDIYKLKSKDTFLVLISKTQKENLNESNKISHSLIKSGADIVMYLDSTNYSVDQYKNKFIIKGLPHLMSKEEGTFPLPLYQLSIVFSEKKLLSIGIKVSPFKLNYELADNVYIPQLCDKTQGKSLIDLLNKNSKNLNFPLSDKFNFTNTNSFSTK
ncbi:hypothetical protein LGK99_02705 [Clostridium algidicarnis]|uniref:hypothetical protein n=1 Tax=Clostridium algidicarnis TaxID=37659 RepID=UPI001C0BA7FD|nr:hypothetical protein [Clostridium algidicarnis]MBU3194117.1 hypothetical protein [Clostridium algidicarnis]MBU3206059.1 hypothetical protein [Clostridium algidicarnis]MCB2286012.1 hypothetical protein [Clostridium algidicarnis]